MTAKPKKTIEMDVMNLEEGDDEHLHASGPNADPISIKVADDIERRFREVNPDAAEDALICGGCVALLMQNVMQELAARAGCDRRSARWFFANMMKAAKEELVRAADPPAFLIELAEATGVDIADVLYDVTVVETEKRMAIHKELATKKTDVSGDAAMKGVDA